ncbi:hypothetical protein [Acetobacter ascendens]|uniref:hypothetical protein n=1 Tax=Acetobacter ascendens TaxID=481146 RepID=UPI000875AA23|nr:hypothetical protein [Acetobacter ascendens]AOW49396.1 hypothetical protein A4R89_08190 [Acetobacter ascendens]
MTTKKEQALVDLDRAYANFKELILPAPDGATYSMAAVLNQIQDEEFRPAVSIFGDTPGDIVLAAATIFGFSSGLASKFKKPEDFVAAVNAGIQCGQGEFPKAQEDAPCSTAKH